MPEIIRIELTDQEHALVAVAARCSDMLGAAGFAREAVLAAARRRKAFAEAVDRVAEASHGALELLSHEDAVPPARPQRPDWIPTRAAAPLEEDEVRFAGRTACWSVWSQLAVKDQGALDEVLADHAETDGRDVFDQAAVLLAGLARHAPFVTGNKRTALVATLAFLDLSGLRLYRRMGDEDAARLVREAARGALDADQVAELLRAVALGRSRSGDEAEER